MLLCATNCNLESSNFKILIVQIERPPLIKESDRNERFYLIALAALCVAGFFYGLGRLPLIGPDEPRYAEVAREMYATGDWITPRLGEIKWFEKPAMTYWLAAIGYALLGETEFAARFGNAVVAYFGVLLLYFFGRRVYSARFGYLSAATLVTCGLWPGFARGATFDLPLAVAIELALISFFLWENKEPHSGRDWLWCVFCFAMGVATLAKGLVGIILPLIVIAPYLVLTQRWRIVLQPRRLALGILVFLSTAATWYAPVIASNGREFIDEFFIAHHFQRYLSNKYRHPQPFYFFPLVAFAGSFPWSFYPVSGAWHLFNRRRDALSDHFGLFLWLWVLAPVVFFSFSGSKLPGYILPIFPAVALIAGRELERWWSGESPPKRSSVLTAALMIAVGIGAGFILQRELGVGARDAWMMASIAIAVAAVYLVLLIMRGGRAATLYLPFGLAMIVVASSHLVFPGLGRRESLRELSLMAVQSARPAERLVFFVNNNQGINFYATGLPLRDHRSDLVTVTSSDEIALLVEASRSKSILVVSRRRWSNGVAASEKLRTEIIGEQRFNAHCSPDCDWVLLRAQEK
jgi:4-amino-4-deoxy-L-arabinose transferase-like glycosyltransferase